MYYMIWDLILRSLCILLKCLASWAEIERATQKNISMSHVKTIALYGK